MIKSKIDARERALEMVKPSDFVTVEEQIECAKKIEKYLIGDAELPEVFDDNAHLKELIEMAKKGIDDVNKRNDDLFSDIIKSLPEDVIRDKGLVGLIPCKSASE